MQICPGCRQENADNAGRCRCGYSFAYEREHLFPGALAGLIKPLLWVGAVFGCFYAYLYFKHNFEAAIDHKSTHELLSDRASWVSEDYSGILVDLPIRLSPNSLYDKFNEALASLYSEFASSHGSIGDTDIEITSMVEARQGLADLEKTAEFTAKTFSERSNVISATHTIDDWQRGDLSGKQLRIQARLQTQELSMRVLLLKRGSRRWTVYTSYHPDTGGAAIAERIIESVRLKQ